MLVNFLNGQGFASGTRTIVADHATEFSSQQAAAARQEIAQFAQGKPDFQALAPAMGHVMLAELQQTGRQMSMQEAYNRVSGKGMNGSSSAWKRRAAISPKGGAPAGRAEETKRSRDPKFNRQCAFRVVRKGTYQGGTDARRKGHCANSTQEWLTKSPGAHNSNLTTRAAVSACRESLTIRSSASTHGLAIAGTQHDAG